MPSTNRGVKWAALRSGIGYECVTFPRGVLLRANAAFRKQEDFEESYMDGSRLMHLKLSFHTRGGHSLKMRRDPNGSGWDKVTLVIGVLCN